MKFIKLSLVAALTASSLAADALKVSGDASFTSNALWRGTSLTDDTATVQGTIGIEHESGLYAGMWGTGLTNGTEIDLYLGYTTELSGIKIDMGYVDYSYTGPDSNGNYEHRFNEFGEIYAGAAYDVGVEFGVIIYKGVMSKDEDSTIIEATVGKDFEVAYVNAAFGYQLDSDIRDAAGEYYSMTVGKSFEAIKGDLFLTYANTTADGSDSVYALTYTTSF